MRPLAPIALALALIGGACAPPRAPAARSGARAIFGSATPPAGRVLRFNNRAEPETIDPGLAVGQPDGRVCLILFEGLTVPDPETLEPRPGQARRWEVSADGLTYVFHLRPGLQWSDGTPLTAADFAWSWRRVLAPASGARNASLLYPIRNAEGYNKGALRDPARVGVGARDDTTLVVTLEHPTAYFLSLTSYYVYAPVPRRAIERHGDRWTRPENLVGNGAFVLESWRQGDHFDFVRNPRYWDAAHVALDRVTAYAVEDFNTAVNLYKAGLIDWTTSNGIPSPFMPYLRGYDDFQHAPFQGVYYYSLNVTRPPLDNPWVRRALAYAVDRDAIARDVLKGMRDPWGRFVAAGYPGYAAPPGIGYDPVRARDCLARAGYPAGQNFPRLSILFSTGEDARRIAEAVQEMWKRTLGIRVELTNQEWGSYLQSLTSLQYDIGARSWIGDYLDPNTFLATMIGGDGNNRTGWSDPRYDALMREAAAEPDAPRRLAVLARAEARLLDGGPIVPLYLMTVNDLVKPYVRGIRPTPLDVHPLRYVSIDGGPARGPAVAAARR